mmetsp:Transcript_431/g.646  ORF Transcript_431/g.646 Transcript_431/m.646 type:complete len:272 (+) Transcript_431:355-1170(+)
MRDWGKGQGCEPTYCIESRLTRTPASSFTSLIIASSKVSPTSTKPARHEYLPLTHRDCRPRRQCWRSFEERRTITAGSMRGNTLFAHSGLVHFLLLPEFLDSVREPHLVQKRFTWCQRPLPTAVAITAALNSLSTDDASVRGLSSLAPDGIRCSSKDGMEETSRAKYVFSGSAPSLPAFPSHIMFSFLGCSHSLASCHFMYSGEIPPSAISFTRHFPSLTSRNLAASLETLSSRSSALSASRIRSSSGELKYVAPIEDRLLRSPGPRPGRL